jgi:hypothetical protein
MYTDQILNEAKIAVSTFSAEQRNLIALGLLEKRMIRIPLKDKITRRMNYALTQKGKYIASNLANISIALNDDKIMTELKGQP